MGDTLAELGEWELIRRLATFAPPGQFADDAAVLSGTAAGTEHRGGALVVNTDVLVEGIHFSDTTTAPADVGWRAAAANLSDLAAMGCTEVVGLTVGLAVPAATAWRWVEGVYEGLREALDTHGGVLLGGDCSAAGQRILAITALGRLAGGDGQAPEGERSQVGAIRRCDGRAGDRLLSTGPHGLSRLGLALLQHEAGLGVPGAAEPHSRREGLQHGEGRRDGSPLTALPEALIRRAIAAHRRPRPRLDAVRALIACRPCGVPWRVAGCDSSDGLAAAVASIAAASGCAARLDRRRLPLDPAMASLPQAELWCLGGGEDFELVLALPSPWAEALVAALPGSGLIGELIGGAAGELGWSDGAAWPLEVAAGGGYQHFR